MTTNVMSQVLETENPQLVVLNGDLISGEATEGSNPSQYLHQVVKPLVDADVLWASTYGNHDSDFNLDPIQDIYNHEIKYQNSLTRTMISSPQAGITNYYLPVYPHKGSNKAPVLMLWFFDSRGGHHATNRGTNSLSGARDDWVDKEVRLLTSLDTEGPFQVPNKIGTGQRMVHESECQFDRQIWQGYSIASLLPHPSTCYAQISKRQFQSSNYTWD